MKKIIGLLAIAVFALAACSPAASASIVGEWSLVSYGDPTLLLPASPGVDTSIEFKPDGTLAGNVGCNGFGGDYDVKDGTIEFGPIVSTLMFCEAVADQESTVLAVFFQSATFALDGDTLTITSADGSSVVALARK